MSWKTFLKIVLLILIAGLTFYFATPKYQFYHDDTRRNVYTGEVEKFSEGRWEPIEQSWWK